MNPAWIRSAVRNYPFRSGRSHLRRFLTRFLPHYAEMQIIGGLKMRLNLRKTGQYQMFWFYEETEAALQYVIRRLLPLGGRMVDCGAAFGLMGFLAKAYRNADVLMIEPWGEACDELAYNIKLNHWEKAVDLWRGAASSASGKTTLHLSDGSNESNSLVWTNTSGRTEEVLTERLDTLLQRKGWDRVDFVKIDAEGHDLEVLKGLGDYLDIRLVPLLMVESIENDEEIYALLQGKGYVPFEAHKTYQRKLARMAVRRDFTPLFQKLDAPKKCRDVLWCAPGSVYYDYLVRPSLP